MKNKKGSALAIFLVIGIFALIAIAGTGVYLIAKPTTNAVVQNTQTEKLVTEITSGKIANLKVWVSDDSATDKSTKLVVPIYCKDDKGNMIADGTSSSSSATTSVQTTTGTKGTCWAFNSSVQTVDSDGVPFDMSNQESLQITIPVYQYSGVGQILFRDRNGDSGKNLSLSGADSDNNFKSMEFKLNGTNTKYNLGGFYFNTVTGSNASLIDASGSAERTGKATTSTSLVSSTIGTKVSARKDNWDFVFEISDPKGLLMEANDYLTTGSIDVHSDVGALTNSVDLVTARAFAKGNYRNALSGSQANVGFGYEDDSPSGASAILSDVAPGDSTFYVTA